MCGHVLGHAVNSLLTMVSLWVLPWIVIFSIAGLWSFLQSKSSEEAEPPLHFANASRLLRPKRPWAA